MIKGNSGVLSQLNAWRVVAAGLSRGNHRYMYEPKPRRSTIEIDERKRRTAKKKAAKKARRKGRN